MTYSVDLSSGITESFFAHLKNIAGSSLRQQKRLTEITLELFQNIRKHTVQSETSKLTITKEKSSYSVCSINMVTAREAMRLQEKIKHINKLDRVALKEQHTKALSQTTLGKKSGAGLGLFRIVMRSDSPITPLFTQLGHNHFLFSLHVTLNA